MRVGRGASRARNDADLDGVRDRADRRPCDLTVAPFDPAAAFVWRGEWDYRVFTACRKDTVLGRSRSLPDLVRLQGGDAPSPASTNRRGNYLVEPHTILATCASIGTSLQTKAVSTRLCFSLRHSIWTSEIRPRDNYTAIRIRRLNHAMPI